MLLFFPLSSSSPPPSMAPRTSCFPSQGQRDNGGEGMGRNDGTEERRAILTSLSGLGGRGAAGRPGRAVPPSGGGGANSAAQPSRRKKPRQPAPLPRLPHFARLRLSGWPRAPGEGRPRPEQSLARAASRGAGEASGSRRGDREAAAVAASPAILRRVCECEEGREASARPRRLSENLPLPPLPHPAAPTQRHKMAALSQAVSTAAGGGWKRRGSGCGSRAGTAPLQVVSSFPRMPFPHPRMRQGARPYWPRSLPSLSFTSSLLACFSPHSSREACRLLLVLSLSVPAPALRCHLPSKS